jgi:serine/threonine protein kinase
MTDPRTLKRCVGDEPLPGYRLISQLGKGGFGEVWKCLAPGGLAKAVKFVTDEEDPNSLEQEYEAFQNIKGIRHPFLLTLERVELIGHELIMVMELADQNMAQRFEQCKAQGMPGIPRKELMRYMVDAAEALDVLSNKHGLQHLDIKPANLFLLGDHIKVGDYGLVSKCLHTTETDGQVVSRGLTPRYVPPEVLDGTVDSRSDQYSLALVYAEMLTGVHPFPGPSAKQYLLQHATTPPNVTHLGPSDQSAILRSLSKTPSDRYPSCLAMVESLLQPSLSQATLLRRHAAGNTTSITNQPRVVPEATLAMSLVTPGEAANTLKNVQQTLRPALVPQLRPSGVVSLDTTMRDNSEMERFPLGSLTHSVDADGRPIRLLTPRLEGGSLFELEKVLNRVSQAHTVLWQKVQVPQPRHITFVSSEAHDLLRDVMAPRMPTWSLQEALTKFLPLARSLDELHMRFKLPHGLLSDKTVLHNGNVFGLWGYGLAELLRLARPDTEWLNDQQYLAPESLKGRFHLQSDQYSLALLLLQSMGAWTPNVKKGRAERPTINWQLMSRMEAATVQRALAVDPADRFANCTDFFKALSQQATDVITLRDIHHVESVDLLKSGLKTTTHRPQPQQFTAELIKAAIQRLTGDDAGTIPVQLLDGRWSIRFPMRWTTALAELKVRAFCDQYHYNKVQLATDTILLKPKHRVAQMQQSVNPVELTIRWPAMSEARMVEVQVMGRWTNTLDQNRSGEHVTAMLDIMRRTFHNVEDRRRNPRIKVDMGLTVYPVNDALQIGVPVTGRCKDVSLTGFNAILNSSDTSDHAFCVFDGLKEHSSFAILAKLVRGKRSEQGDQLITGWRFVHVGDRD